MNRSVINRTNRAVSSIRYKTFCIFAISRRIQLNPTKPHICLGIADAAKTSEILYSVRTLYTVKGGNISMLRVLVADFTRVVAFLYCT